MKKLEAKYVVAIIISLIIGISILSYGYLDYKYEKEALEQKIKSEEQAKLGLQNCLNDASKKFSRLLEGKATSMEEVKMKLDYDQGQRNDCFKKYPQ